MLSKLKKQHFKNKEVTWLAIFAIIMIPLGTYLFGTKESPFYYTLSMIGNRLGYRLRNCLIFLNNSFYNAAVGGIYRLKKYFI